MESFFEFIKLPFFFVKVLDESSPPLLHLVESSFKSFDDAGHGSLHLSPVLRVPDVVGDKLLNRFFPLLLKQVFVAHHLQLVHQAVNVLYQDVIARYKHFLLLPGRLLGGGGSSRRLGVVAVAH